MWQYINKNGRSKASFTLHRYDVVPFYTIDKTNFTRRRKPVMLFSYISTYYLRMFGLLHDLCFDQRIAAE